MTAGRIQVRLRILDAVACGVGVVPRKHPGLDNESKQLDGT